MGNRGKKERMVYLSGLGIANLMRKSDSFRTTVYSTEEVDETINYMYSTAYSLLAAT